MNSENKKLQALVVSRQIGSARAFVAWLKEPNTTAAIDAAVLSYATCAREFSDLRHDVISGFTPPKLSFDFVISGTSVSAKEDADVYRWARANKIPSIAFVDQWINYSERFDLENQPSHIFCIDGKAKADLLNLPGLSAGIHAVGTPALNYIKNYWITRTRTKDSREIYFATEPSSLPGGNDEYRARHGICDIDMLRFLITSLQAQPKQGHNLNILLHPIDSEERVLRELNLRGNSENLQLKIVREEKHDVFAKAAAVFGMRSMFLLESGLLGIPTYSLQIGRKTGSSLTDDRSFIGVITEPGQMPTDFTAGKPDPLLLNNTWTETIRSLL